MAKRSASPIHTLFISALVAALTGAPCSAADYPDVPKWHWAWAYIQGVSNAQVAGGYDDGLYRPDLIVSRAQMAVFIARAMCGGDPNVPPGPPEASFPDVPATGYGDAETDPHWAYKYVEYAVAQGVVSGYDDGYYHPDWEVTRGQMAAFLARALCGGDDNVPPHTGSPTFPDITPDNENAWCYDYVEYMAQEEVALGYPEGFYLPNIPCSRDQMAVYLCRAFDLPVPPVPFNITDHFPLGEGDTWTYESEEWVYTKAVAGTADIGGETCTVVAALGDGAAEYWHAEQDGLAIAGFLDPSAGLITFQPFPKIPNGLDPWDEGTETVSVYQNSLPAGEATFTYRFWGTETVAVPAGTFEDCMKVEIQMNPGGEDMRFLWWLARGVGVVKIDSGYFGGDEWEVLLTADVGDVHHPRDHRSMTVAHYYALDVGSTWAFSGLEGTTVDQVVGVQEMEGVEAARIAEGPDDAGPSFTYFAVIDGALSLMGEYDAGSDSAMALSPPLAFPVTAALGDTGSAESEAYVDGLPGGTVTFDWAVVDTRPVTVAGGTFDDCLKLRLRITDPVEGTGEFYLWQALGVGPVMEDARPFGDSYWEELIAADAGGVEHPTWGRAFDVTDYCDLSVGNAWSYDDGRTAQVIGTTAEGGHQWSDLDDGHVDGWDYHLRTDALGLHYLGYSGGIAATGVLRFDPPLLIENGLSPGDGGVQSADVYYYDDLVGQASLEYTFEGIQSASTEAGLFTDCMKLRTTLATPVSPTSTTTIWWARDVGIVQMEDDVSGVRATLASATIGSRQYPVTGGTYDPSDYQPLTVNDILSTVHQGDWLGAGTREVTDSVTLNGLPEVELVYVVEENAGDEEIGGELMTSDGRGLGRHGHREPGGTYYAVSPPLIIPNGVQIGDSGSLTPNYYIGTPGSWTDLGPASMTWRIVDAGAVRTSAGYFPDCLLIRWSADVPFQGLTTMYEWVARGVGRVKAYELDGLTWSELMGASVSGDTTPPDVPPAFVNLGVIAEGSGIGFDFSTGIMVAQPENQDLQYISSGPTDTRLESFATDGISRALGEGIYDFPAHWRFSTFLPPGYDLWGEVWGPTLSVLADLHDATGSTTAVKTREGRYALVRITNATTVDLEIEYVYPYGWFTW